jgi:phosphomannomutase/phosphoglucomutase
VVELRFEAESDAAMARIQAEFRAVLGGAMPGASLPF